MRGAPHAGFAVDIARIRSRISRDTWGRPPPGRLFHRQKARNPCRCHLATVVRSLVERFETLMMPVFASHRTAVWDERGVAENNAYPVTPPEGWDIDKVEAFTYDTPANPTMGIIIPYTSRRAIR